MARSSANMSRQKKSGVTTRQLLEAACRRWKEAFFERIAAACRRTDAPAMAPPAGGRRYREEYRRQMGGRGEAGGRGKIAAAKWVAVAKLEAASAARGSELQRVPPGS